MEQEQSIDELDRKLSVAFAGRVVRKDLVKRLKVGFSIPVYVLEYLLGKYCSTADPAEIEEGLKLVKSAIAERIVRGDENELVKARLQRSGSLKLIDAVTVTFDEKVQGGKFWAKLATCGLDKVHISHELVHANERLLTGGVWANVELVYDDSLTANGAIRPFVLHRFAPIQIANANLGEFIEARGQFTREEWIDVLMRSMGYESNHPDFSPRRKLLYLLRLIPMVEKNFNMIELGPRGTGKSYVYRQISPYVILLSGGQGGVPDLFGWKNRKDKPGLVLKYDMVAFDEVAGSTSRTRRTNRHTKTTWRWAPSREGMTREPYRRKPASCSTATSMVTWKRLRGFPTCLRRCRIRFATTWRFTTAGTPTCRGGKCPRCRPTTSLRTWA